jgi:hypothetical protein
MECKLLILRCLTRVARRIFGEGQDYRGALASFSKSAAGEPFVIRCTSTEKDPVKLDVKVYQVRYR